MITNVGDDPARLGRLDAILEGRGMSQRLNRGINPNPAGELLDLRYWVALVGIDDNISTNPFGQGFSVRFGLDRDHSHRAKKSRGHSVTQADRALVKNGDRTTDRYLGVFCTG